MLGYLVASMKATPIDPTFLEARDAFLAVARASDEQDYRSFRKAFAERGMGAGAVAPEPDSNDLRSVIESLREEGPALSFIAASLDDRMAGDADGLLDQGEEGILTVRLRNTGFEDLSGTTVHVTAVGEHSEVTEVAGRISSAPGEDIAVEFPVALRTASHYELIKFDVTFADEAAGVPARVVRAGLRVHYDLAHTGSRDSVDSPVTQSDWFPEQFVPWSETVWARVSSADEHAYHIGSVKFGGFDSLISPCILASTTDDLILRFGHAYRLDTRGYVEVKTADSEFDWQTVYLTGGSSGVEAVEVNLQQEYAGQWLQARFIASVPATSDKGVPSWTVDDIEFAGIENTPFAAIHPHGGSPSSQ